MNTTIITELVKKHGASNVIMAVANAVKPSRPVRGRVKKAWKNIATDLTHLAGIAETVEGMESGTGDANS